MRFSERNGKRTVKIDIQVDSMDSDLRNGLWNVFSLLIVKPMEEHVWLSQSSFEGLVLSLYIHFFKEPVDEIPNSVPSLIKELRKRFFQWDYLDVYDFIDFIGQVDDEAFDQDEFRNTCDVILKTELSGYRFVSLVSCSAFTNYLIAKAIKHGVKIK